MHEKEIEKLQAEKEKVERQLAQEQHKIQRLENRAAYYEKGGRNRVLRPCRTGLCSARCAKASHGSCQPPCRR